MNEEKSREKEEAQKPGIHRRRELEEKQRSDSYPLVDLLSFPRVFLLHHTTKSTHLNLDWSSHSEREQEEKGVPHSPWRDQERFEKQENPALKTPEIQRKIPWMCCPLEWSTGLRQLQLAEISDDYWK